MCWTLNSNRTLKLIELFVLKLFVIYSRNKWNRDLETISKLNSSWWVRGKIRVWKVKSLQCKIRKKATNGSWLHSAISLTFRAIYIWSILFTSIIAISKSIMISTQKDIIKRKLSILLSTSNGVSTETERNRSEFTIHLA